VVVVGYDYYHPHRHHRSSPGGGRGGGRRRRRWRRREEYVLELGVAISESWETMIVKAGD